MLEYIDQDLEVSDETLQKVLDKVIYLSAFEVGIVGTVLGKG